MADRWNLRVDDMHNTISDENIRSDDLRAVHEHSSVVDSDSQVCAVNSRNDSPVHQTAAVSDRAVDDVVCQDVGKVGCTETSETRADSLESRVRGREDGNVAEVVDDVDEAGASRP